MRLRALLPEVKLVQVIHVRGEESVEEAVAIAPSVALLLDSGNPSLALKELGGTGVRTDGRLDPTRLGAFFAAIRASPS